jgi:tape measure domain-containing protein
MSSRYSVSVLIAAIDKATAPIRKIHQGLDSLKKVDGIKRLGAALENVRTQFQNVMHEAGLFAMRMGILATATAGVFGAFIKPAAAMEQFRMTLVNLYNGDMLKAGKTIDWIQKKAAASPYAFEQILDSAVMLKNAGIEPLNGTLEHMLDFFAARGVSQVKMSNVMMQLTQAWAKGKLQGEDLRATMGAGIPILDMLAKVMKKPTSQIQELGSKGKITRDVMKKLFDLMGREGAKGAGKMANMWSTLTSNLGDKWFQFADFVMNFKLPGGSVFDTMKKDVAGIGAIMDRYMQPKNAAKVAQALKDVYTTARELVLGLLPLAKLVYDLGKAFVQLSGGPANAVKALIGLMAVPLVMSILGFIASAVELITVVIGWGPAIMSAVQAFAALLMGSEVLGTALAGLGAIFAFLGSPIAATIGLVAAFTVLPVLLIFHWQKVVDFFKGFFNIIKAGFTLLLKFGDRINKLNVKLPDISFYKTKAHQSKEMESYYPGRTLAMAPPIKMSPLNSMAAAALKPKKDELTVKMNVNVEKGTATITQAKHRGDSDMRDFYNAGFTQGLIPL